MAFASSVLRAVAASAQFIAVAAHTDDYDAYAVALLRSTSLDLLAAVRDATSLLQALDPPCRLEPLLLSPIESRARRVVRWAGELDRPGLRVVGQGG